MALIGPSGAGKTSFLRAGIVPHAPPGWRCLVATPGQTPFAALARALRIRRIQDFGEDCHRLAIQFTGNSPEKVLIVRYIYRRHEQISLEVQKLFEARYQSQLAEV